MFYCRAFLTSLTFFAICFSSHAAEFTKIRPGTKVTFKVSTYDESTLYVQNQRVIKDRKLIDYDQPYCSLWTTHRQYASASVVINHTYQFKANSLIPQDGFQYKSVESELSYDLDDAPSEVNLSCYSPFEAAHGDDHFKNGLAPLVDFDFLYYEVPSPPAQEDGVMKLKIGAEVEFPIALKQEQGSSDGFYDLYFTAGKVYNDLSSLPPGPKCVLSSFDPIEIGAGKILPLFFAREGVQKWPLAYMTAATALLLGDPYAKWESLTCDKNSAHYAPSLSDLKNIMGDFLLLRK